MNFNSLLRVLAVAFNLFHQLPCATAMFCFNQLQCVVLIEKASSVFQFQLYTFAECKLLLVLSLR